ncbi:MAG: hypothetical protein JST68_22595 [Bacteroidetes bacterium]|nr:hypothetical protein [Bacteroidota bacterium]
MKKLLLLVLFTPFFKRSEAQFTLTNSSTISLVELRAATETWPLDLQRVIKDRDTTYALSYRDQQFGNSVVMASLKFKDKAQLKYFQQALSSLAQLGTGTTANFKGFSIKRADVMKDAPSAPQAPKPDPKSAKNAAPPAPVKRGPAKVGEVWYLLTCDDGTVTNFQQSEADKMVAAILPL